VRASKISKVPESSLEGYASRAEWLSTERAHRPVGFLTGLVIVCRIFISLMS